jgi:hypothetical protein
MKLVQITRNPNERRAALVDGPQLRLLRAPAIYSLAMQAAETGSGIRSAVEQLVTDESLDYDPVYEGRSEWRLLPAFDHPHDPAHCLVSGTGLTHKASAENRAAMHKRAEAEITDSIRMYQMGLEAGLPAPGQIGVQPEWFYKGDGGILKAHGEELVIPPYGWDGGEEPEIAGVYLISGSGKPFRVGLTVGNEFSDHKMEKKNYLYLAPSKLRNCSIGPELTVDEIEFHDVPGTVAIFRNHQTIWKKDIWTGQKNMSHSVANLEHHHFKYETHRRPGDVHIHFFGADAFSFGDGLTLEEGDLMEVSFPQFGRALRNPLKICQRPESLVQVKQLGAFTV